MKLTFIKPNNRKIINNNVKLHCQTFLFQKLNQIKFAIIRQNQYGLQRKNEKLFFFSPLQ